MGLNLKNPKTRNFFYIGPSKFALGRFSFTNPSDPRLIFFKESPASGFSKGHLTDLESASREVKRLFEAAELDNFPEVIVTISHPEVRGYTFSSSIFYSAKQHMIQAEDLDEVIRQTRNVSMIPLKETILQSIPQEYWVNDSRGIQNPIDLEAERLGVSLRLLSIAAEDYQGLAKIFDRSEAEIREVVPKALGTSFAVLEENEKRSGVLLVVVGSYTTDLVYYKENILYFSKSFPWGSEHLTRVLSEKFRLKPDEARRLKEDFGTLLEGSTDEESLPLSREEFGTLVLKRRELREVLTSSLESFFGSLEREIKTVQAQEGPLVQLVLSGGGAKLEGLLEKIESRYAIPTRLGSSKAFNLEAGVQVSWDPSWSALWGTVRRESERIRLQNKLRQSRNILSRAAGQAREWLEAYF